MAEEILYSRDISSKPWHRKVGSPLVPVLIASCMHSGMVINSLLAGLGFTQKDLVDTGTRVD
jgi:hypothetical protein